MIIITTYVNLRKKLQLTTLALAELTAEKSNKLKEKYINLILFRPPKEPNNDEEEQKTTSRILSTSYRFNIFFRTASKEKNLF